MGSHEVAGEAGEWASEGAARAAAFMRELHGPTHVSPHSEYVDVHVMGRRTH